MKYSWFIAKRYLVSKREATFITVISIISIIGITIGVAALLIVLSVFNGFNALVTDILIGFDPHIRMSFNSNISSNEIQRLKSELQNQGSVGIGEFVNGKVMLISKKSTRVIYLRGIESTAISKVSGLKDKIIYGNADVNENNENKIILGYSLADKLGLDVGDSVFVLSAASAKNYLLNMQIPKLIQCEVTGIYESNNRDYDALYGFTSLNTGKRIYHIDKASGIDIRLQSLSLVDKVKDDIQESFGSNAITIQTWYDLHKDLYSVMQVERWTAFTILTLIIIVATFNLLGSLTMTVIEKTRDIGILKSMGARESEIRRIFRLEGIIIGIVGALLGSGLAYVVCWAQIQYHWFPLDETVYIIPALPIDMRISDFVIVALSTFVFCYLATLYPSTRAAKLLPAEAIRWE